MAVAYDITRLFLGPLQWTPRGIDRVELVLANHFFRDDQSDNVGVLPTPWGIRIFDASTVRRGLRRLETLWAENGKADDDDAWRNLRARLRDDARETYRQVKPMPPLARLKRLGAVLTETGVSPGRSAARSIPRGSVYLNIGQIGLAVPLFLRWLNRRPDVASIFMLHDVIPLENPEFVSADSARHHAAMVASTARFADGLIVTTEHARSSVAGALATFGRPAIPTLARGLPLPAAFHGSVRPHPELAGLRYFVVCGSIEPRKNHALLHEVWKRLACRFGAATPHLVMVGSPGWNSKPLLDALEGCELTRRHIHPVARLSSPALKQLMAGAAGLLMPSWNEGFGLPVLEANALGIPTIASDIPSHREVANRHTLLIDPGDIDAWERVITGWTRDGSPATSPDANCGDARDYAIAIHKFLDLCARGNRARPAPRGSMQAVTPTG